MPVRLRRSPRHASPNLRTLRYGVEKETECGFANIGDNTTTPESNVQTTAYRQTTVCFNLALNPNSAECTRIHTTLRPIFSLFRKKSGWVRMSKCAARPHKEGL
jgi:hypothetical protein